MLKKSCVTACHSITHVVNLGSRPATHWCRLSLIAYIVDVYIYWSWPRAARYEPTEYLRSCVSDENIMIQEPQICNLLRLVAFSRQKKLDERIKARLHIAYFSFSSKCKNRKPDVNLCVLSLWMIHVYSEVDNLWRWTQLPVVRDVVAYSVTRGYPQPVQCSFRKCYWNT